MSLIRYPGSKAKLATGIVGSFPAEMALQLWMNEAQWEYREPFFGAGAVGFNVLAKLPPTCSAWINDKDFGLACLWQAVWKDPQSLCESIEAFSPSVQSYREFKESDGEWMDPVKAGFQKLALHQMSFSGLGAKSGSPLGGWTQANSAYSVDCRWNPGYLCQTVMKLSRILNRIQKLRITGWDFRRVFQECSSRAFYYVDPPYYQKGEQLYTLPLADADHRDLAACLKESAHPWVLSYDDDPFIRQLYDGCRITPMTITYTTAVRRGQRPKNREILIRNPV